MDYVIAGLILFAIGNLIHLERVVSKLQGEVKHIKEFLKEKEDG